MMWGTSTSGKPQLAPTCWTAMVQGQASPVSKSSMIAAPDQRISGVSQFTEARRELQPWSFFKAAPCVQPETLVTWGTLGQADA